jgi:hypothetical protein
LKYRRIRRRWCAVDGAAAKLKPPRDLDQPRRPLAMIKRNLEIQSVTDGRRKIPQCLWLQDESQVQPDEANGKNHCRPRRVAVLVIKVGDVMKLIYHRSQRGAYRGLNLPPKKSPGTPGP